MTSSCKVCSTEYRRVKVFNNQKGIAHIALIVILLVGIVAGVVLIQKKGFQIFKPKAATENIVVNPQDGNDDKGNRCEVKDVGGKKQTNCPTVKLQLTSPLDINKFTDAGPNISLVKTAYAEDNSPTGVFCRDNERNKVFRYEEDTTKRIGTDVGCIAGPAVLGFAAGSVFPVIGNITGGIVGGIVGGVVCFVPPLFGHPEVFENTGAIKAVGEDCPSGLVCSQQGDKATCIEPPAGGDGSLDEQTDRWSCGEDNKVHRVLKSGEWRQDDPSLDCNVSDRKCLELYNYEIKKWDAKCVAKTPPADTSCKGLGVNFPEIGSGNLVVNIYNDEGSRFNQGQKESGKFAIFHCKTAGTGACAPNDTPDDIDNTFNFTKDITLTAPAKGPNPLQVSLSSLGADLPDKVVSVVAASNLCGRYQVDVGVSCGVIGGRVYNTGRTCGQQGGGGVQPPATDVTPTAAPAAPSSVSCTKTCTYNQGGKCYRGNCTDGSITCSNNVRCGYVSACSGSGNEEPCPPAQGGTVPAPAPATSGGRTTKYYKIGLSSGEALGAPKVPYTGPGMERNYPLSNGSNYIYVMFVDDKSEFIDVTKDSKYAQVQVDYNPPSSQVAPAPAKQTDNTNQSLYISDLVISPSVVRKKADNTYPEVKISVSGATKPWTLYFNNKPGANCGGSCSLEGWTAIKTGESSATVGWTPPAHLKGTYTLGIIDLNFYRVVKTADLTLEDQSGSTGSLEGVKIKGVTVSKDPSGKFRPVVVEVTAPSNQTWKVYYNQDACGQSCNPGSGWTSIGFGTGTSSMEWSTIPSFVSGQHAIAIIDTDANKIIDVRNVNFSVSPTGDGSSNDQ